MAAERAQNLQDTFLNHVRKAKIPLTIFLVNGVKLQGVVTWFDNFCVLLRRDGHSQLVYKHAISTIMPGHPIQLFEGGEEPPAGDKALVGTTPARQARRSPEPDGVGRGDRPRYRHRAVAQARGARARAPARAAANAHAARRASKKPPGLRAPSISTWCRRGWSRSTACGRRPTSAPARSMNRRAGQKPFRLRRRDGLPDLAGAAAQSGKGLERESHRPHRADPGNLRPARAHARRRAAGRARASHLSEKPAGALLDPSRAPARRLRLSRRAGRDAARSRPARDRRPHQTHRRRTRQGQAHPQAASRQPQARALSDRGAGRLHQCRQVDAVQPHDRGERAVGRHAVRHARPDAAGGRAAARQPHHSVRYRRLHLRSADHAGGGLPRHARRGDRGRRHPACARHVA